MRFINNKRKCYNFCVNKFSVVVPCYNEEGITSLFYKEAIPYIKKISKSYELIFINDGSKDNTLNELLELKKNNKNIKIIDFSRNFGKEAAMLAGLKEAEGDLVAVMDVDLQDPPSLLKEMYDAVNSGEYDCVATRRVTRKGEPPIRSFFAKCFYKLINSMIEVEIVDGARDFRMMSRQMVDSIISLPEHNRFSKGLFAWVGFNTKYIEFENKERVAGETKWSFWGLFKYAIEGIVSFTTAPLTFAITFGVLSFIAGIVLIVLNAISLLNISNFVLLIVILFLSSVQLLSLGIIGEYLAKTYIEIKNRPNYIIKKKY